MRPLAVYIQSLKVWTYGTITVEIVRLVLTELRIKLYAAFLEAYLELCCCYLCLRLYHLSFKNNI